MSDDTTEFETRLFGRAYATLESEIRQDTRLGRALDLVEKALRDGLDVSREGGRGSRAWFGDIPKVRGL